ncbi:MAG: hypothetical protein ACYDDY_17410 [Mucilaginibacter sp.]
MITLAHATGLLIQRTHYQRMRAKMGEVEFNDSLAADFLYDIDKDIDWLLFDIELPEFCYKYSKSDK